MRSTVVIRRNDAEIFAVRVRHDQHVVHTYPAMHDWMCLRRNRRQSAATARFWPSDDARLHQGAGYFPRCPHCAEGVR